MTGCSVCREINQLYINRLVLSKRMLCKLDICTGDKVVWNEFCWKLQLMCPRISLFASPFSVVVTCVRVTEVLFIKHMHMFSLPRWAKPLASACCRGWLPELLGSITSWAGQFVSRFCSVHALRLNSRADTRVQRCPL